MENNNMSKILSIILIALVVLLFALCIVYLILKLKESKQNSKSNKKVEINSLGKKNKPAKQTNKSAVSLYDKQSIFDFMEFDEIKDNMIIQKDGKRFLIVVECQGVNYDLMSSMEKVSVEEGFQQFLNTLRHPIQIYIQTRTMNLEKSITTYKERVKKIEENYNKLNREHRQMKESEAYSEEDLNKHLYDVTKSRNLLEYGKDIIANTERMSLNKNVLTKKYYIIIPHYSEEASEGKYSKEEIRNMAFSELYTKAQSIVSTLSACSVSGRILNSNELVELLYMSYNREDADIYGFDKALKAEYDSLYTTAPNVFEKKLKVLDEEIRNRAIDLANKKIEEVKSVAQQKAEEKEDAMQSLVRRMAKSVLNENKAYVGPEIAKQAIEEIEKDEESEEEGGSEDEKVKKTSRRSKKQ